MLKNRLLAAVCLAGAASVVCAEQEVTTPDAGPYFDKLPIVLTPSRLPQPIDEAPAAVTVIDHDLIEATGYRDLARLLRLVPGMQVGQERAGNNWVTYHGMGNDTPVDMQVLIDGRAIYSPGMFSGVDWHTLPVAPEEIDRIEVVRGTNTATYGPNAFLGVINIITRHSADSPGYQAGMAVGSPSVRDLHGGWAGGGNGNTLRLSATHREDEGYQDLNDSSRVNLASLRTDHRLSDTDELTFRLAGSEGRRGTGYVDSLFDSNPLRDWSSQDLAIHGQWRHTPEAAQELLVSFSSVSDRYRDHWTAVGPRPDLGYARLAYVPLNQDRDTVFHSLELQHSLALSQETRFVWGGQATYESLEGAALFYGRDRLTNKRLNAFANIETRIAPTLLASFAGAVEKYTDDRARLSPRAFLNWHASSDATLRAGYARAWRDRNDFQTYCDFRAVDPVDGRVMARPYLPNPDLRRPRVDSLELGYLGRFKPGATSLDVRLFRERITDFVLRTGVPPTPDNPVLAAYVPTTQYQNMTDPVTLVGVEYQIKARPLSGSQIILNHSLLDRRTSNAAVAARAAPYTASLSWLQELSGNWSAMVTVLRMGPLAGGDGYVPKTQYVAPPYTTTDFRIAKRMHRDSHQLEIALAGINLGPRHQEIAERSEQYIHPGSPANPLSRMLFLSVSMSSR